MIGLAWAWMRRTWAAWCERSRKCSVCGGIDCTSMECAEDRLEMLTW